MIEKFADFTTALILLIFFIRGMLESILDLDSTMRRLLEKWNFNKAKLI